jgi:subtilisin family serine protease
MRSGGFHRVRCVLAVLTLSLVFSPFPHFSSALLEPASAQSEPQELEAFQGYLEPAPGGMDIRYAWGLPGGRGENVTIVDVEINWNLRHNDLAAATADPVVLVRGSDPNPDINIDHGTAVLGELFAAPDGIGVTGIAHRARLGLVSPLSEGNVPRLAEAITRAARDLQPGDVILIEAQSFAGPRLDPQTGRGLAPIEYENSIFDAIKAATSKGIVVVEPAANGFDNLEHNAYGGAFDRTRRDSGAIMVGSGFPPAGIYGPGPDLTRTEESNYGSRVDLQGWGRFVTTCGYGDLRREQGENNWYTDRFGATSAAAAMVAGAAALLQSVVKARGQAPLSPLQLRRLLTTTGTPQTGDLSEHIGPRPNLRAAIEALDTTIGYDPRIRSLKLKGSSGKLIVDGENFFPSDSIIEIGGTPVTKLKYPSSYFLPGGITTRIMTKRDVTDMLPRGVDISITVFTPTTERRSAPFIFRRD